MLFKTKTETNKQQIEKIDKIPSKVNSFFMSVPTDILNEIHCIIDCNGYTTDLEIIKNHAMMIHDNCVYFACINEDRFLTDFISTYITISVKNYFNYLTVYLRDD